MNWIEQTAPGSGKHLADKTVYNGLVLWLKLYDEY